MKTKLVRFAAIAAVAGAAVIGLSACASPAPEPTSSGIITPVQEPIMLDYSAINGQTVDAKVGQVVVINFGDADASGVTVTFDPEGIATWTAPGHDDTATYNGGITAVKAGTTTVSFLQGKGAVQLTLNVTE